MTRPQARPPDTESIRCSRCFVEHAADRWSDLAHVTSLRSSEVTAHMTAWPWQDDAVIEVRRCTCGSTLARHVEP